MSFGIKGHQVCGFQSFKLLGQCAGVHRNYVRPALKSLANKRIIAVDWENKRLMFNKRYMTWNVVMSAFFDPDAFIDAIEMNVNMSDDDTCNKKLLLDTKDATKSCFSDNLQTRKCNKKLLSMQQNVAFRLKKCNKKLHNEDDKVNDGKGLENRSVYNIDNIDKEKKEDHSSNTNTSIYTNSKEVATLEDDEKPTGRLLPNGMTPKNFFQLISTLVVVRSYLDSNDEVITYLQAQPENRLREAIECVRMKKPHTSKALEWLYNEVNQWDYYHPPPKPKLKIIEETPEQYCKRTGMTMEHYLRSHPTPPPPDGEIGF